jgi:hypothetical protein
LWRCNQETLYCKIQEIQASGLTELHEDSLFQIPLFVSFCLVCLHVL